MTKDRFPGEMTEEDIAQILDALRDYRRWFDGDDDADAMKRQSIDRAIRKVEALGI